MRQDGWFRRLFGGNAASPDERDEGAVDRLLAMPVAERKQGRLPSFRRAASVRSRPQDDRLESFRARVRSAFSPSRPVIDSELYSGRTQLLKTLISAVEDSNMHVVIFGTRGIGKTSTLHLLSAMARDARYLVHYGSCGQNVTFAELFGAVLAGIPLLYHQDYDPVAPEIEQGLTFADLFEDEPITVPMLSETFTKISSTQLIIILDEFDRIEGEGVRRLVAELIKNLSDRAAPVQLVIAGVAQNIDEIVEHIPSIRRNILAVRMPNMDAAETRELIDRGAQRSGLRFTDPAADRIAELALGLPFIATLLSHHASLLAIERGEETVVPADVEGAIAQALEEIELRLNPALLRSALRAIDAGMARLLGELGRRSLTSGGTFPVPADLDGVSLDRLEREFRLLRTVEIDGSRDVAFVEEGLPVFLWIHHTASQNGPAR